MFQLSLVSLVVDTSSTGFGWSYGGNIVSVGWQVKLYVIPRVPVVVKYWSRTAAIHGVALKTTAALAAGALAPVVFHRLRRVTDVSHLKEGNEQIASYRSSSFAGRRMSIRQFVSRLLVASATSPTGSLTVLH